MILIVVFLKLDLRPPGLMTVAGIFFSEVGIAGPHAAA
jgi:hypothetical protein